ncbi:MAG: hypothetical protein ACI9JN_001821 [Bacteroidia bacterium]|jgi:hypothetical protein
MKKLIFSLLIGTFCQLTFAQGDIDALRYSQSEIGSSARSLGIGGAFGALGADLSSAQINPAGFALYRSNAFSFGGSMINSKSNIEFQNQTKKDFDFNLALPSIGFVFYNGEYEKRKPATKGWLNTNFSMTINRTNNFNGIRNYSGENTQNSMLDYFAERANGLSVNELSASSEELEIGYFDLETMAWDAYLIDSVGSRTFGAAIDPLNRAINQKNVITTKGGTHDIGLHLSSNYENKFYIGGGINVSTVRYKEENRFIETDESTNFTNWSSWSLRQNILTKGVGISANLGFIVRPNNNVRFGASLKTPTIYNLRDEYSDEMVVDYDDGTYGEYKTAEGYYEYKVMTPIKTTLSGAYLFGKNGFISTDIEFVDYSTMRLRPTNNAFEVANDVISSKYGDAVNIRLGGEYVRNMIRFRGGVARYASPLTSAKEDNLAQHYITGGIGLKDKNWALDMSVVQQLGKEAIQPYSLDAGIVPVATNKSLRSSLVISLTTKF